MNLQGFKLTNKAAAALTFNHLDALNLSLSNERTRMAAAKTNGERNLRSVWVRQLEKEIAQERVVLGVADRAENESISDDDLLASLVCNGRKTMTFFSFRAECLADVAEFKSACAASGVTTSLVEQPDAAFPDVEVELEASATLAALRNVMRSVVDGHVMLQTLRECRLKDNSLERDYDLE